MDKKKLTVIGITVLVVTIIIIILALIPKKETKEEYLEEFKKEDKKVLVEKSYINGAWGFVYDGIVIFNDGTIYKFAYGDDYQEYKYNDLKAQTEWILENGHKQDEKVTKDVVEKLEENIENLEDKIKSKNTAMDAGSDFIAVWNYKDNKKIKLKEKGDYTGTNTTASSKEIQSLIKDYIKD